MNISLLQSFRDQVANVQGRVALSFFLGRRILSWITHLSGSSNGVHRVNHVGPKLLSQTVVSPASGSTASGSIKMRISREDGLPLTCSNEFSWIAEFFLIGHWWFQCKGFKELALKGEKNKMIFHPGRCKTSSVGLSVRLCCFVLLNQYWGIVMYGPGASLWASQGRHTHDPRSPTSQPYLVPP